MSGRLALLIATLIAVSIAALALGPVALHPGELWRVLAGGADPVARAVGFPEDLFLVRGHPPAERLGQARGEQGGAHHEANGPS